MTKISPKPSSSNETNGRYSYPQNSQIDARNYATYYPPSLPYRVQPSPEQPSLQLPQLEAIQQINHTQAAQPPRWQFGQWFSRRLQVKVTALAIALGTLPVALIGTTAYFTASQKVEQEVMTNDQITATDLLDKLELFIAERYGDIQVISTLTAFTDPQVREQYTQEDKNDALERFVRTYQVYDGIGVFDLQGNMLAESQEKAFSTNIYNRVFFQEVLKTDRPYISEPELSATTNQLSLFLTAPVKDKETGQTIAIVLVRMPMTAVQEKFGIKVERGQHIYVFGENNEVIASDLSDKIGKKLEEAIPQLSSEIQAKGNQLLSLVTPINQEENIVVYTPSQNLKESYNLDWNLVISRPAKIAFAAQEQLLFTLFLGAAATTVVVGALATFVTNRGMRPILAAASAVDKIGQGELDTRVDIQGDDELAALGANINQMAGQLAVFVQEQELAAEQARLLADITGSRTLSSSELKDLFQNAVEETRQILNAERVILYHFNSGGSGSVAAESVVIGWPRTLNDRIEDLDLSQERREAYKEGSVVAINNVFETELSPEQQKTLARLGVKANLEVPILHEGQPYGLLMAHHCSAPHDWQSSEVNFFKQLAGQLGLVIDRVMLLEETETLAQEQRELKEGLQQRALELLKEVDPISKGDLTVRARVTADEIGTVADSYNATVSNLRKIVEQVQQAAQQVAQTTSSNEVAVQSLSTEALRQAQEIGSALERAQEMAGAVQKVASNADQAAAAVREAAQTVSEGDANMNRTVEGILAIRETVAETAKKVKHLGESSQKISTVVSLISTFAAQTNLLALNASIEAARAGEEGRGFAVVADEVRALARQSAEATAEIEKLVAAIQGETNEVVAAMEAGTEQVVTGTKLVDETRKSLNKITVASNQINELVEAIADATVIQSQASEAVTQTMTGVAQIAAQTSTEAGQVSLSFEELRKVAQALQQEVGQFKLN